MTVQAINFNTSKKALQEQLNLRAELVHFVEPMMVHDRRFTGDEIKVGQSFPVVMDPQTRRRFATVKRVSFAAFKVS